MTHHTHMQLLFTVEPFHGTHCHRQWFYKLIKLPIGTTFFIELQIENFPSTVYAVTALHIIRGAYGFGKIYIRLNQIDGTTQDYPIDVDDWYENQTTDVAVMPFTIPDSVEFKVIPSTMLVSSDVPHWLGFGIAEGDEVFYVGMFAGHTGEKRNLPIIRFGNISLMPHEKVLIKRDPHTDNLYPVDAYLVECRSRSGLSGSPVFVYFPATREQGKVINYHYDDIPLLGLVHGHYKTDIQDQITTTNDDLDTVLVNSGISIVIPAQDILNTLMQKEVMKDREKKVEQIKERIKKIKTQDLDE